MLFRSIAFAPAGSTLIGYVSIALLGVGYSLVPAAMWPSVPKIIPEKNLGTAYSLIYWIQNMGMLLVPIFVGRILSKYILSADALAAKGIEATPEIMKNMEVVAAVKAEYLFVALGVVAVGVSIFLAISSKKNPHLELDLPNKRS